ncbi:glycosyltransferase family 2 protein [Sinimarinibacterium thermocellulolyticum]|uniref:Glycosyltransferase n=1 Tax=Sinimarinibacterium thermocellulolyticum TaxID=3170016 RepID=A0ABV2A9U3_9GAMM
MAVPYKDFDVLPLAHRLVAMAADCAGRVEILFADDGSEDRDIGRRLLALFAGAPVACRLLSFAANIGRSAIRNRLAQAARGLYVLYLDADMLPDRADFLARYLRHVESGALDVVCGGRSYLQVRDWPAAQALYRYFSLRTECVGPQVRNTRPLWYLLTNNLCVQRRLLLQHPFHESFRGWGFEDADWALKLGDVRVLHIDNPATHTGLLDERELLSKYDSSLDNFRLICRSSPEFRRFALYRASRMLAFVPLPAALMRMLARQLVLTRALPMWLRYLGVHGYRAASYAGVLRQDALRRLARPRAAPHA